MKKQFTVLLLAAIWLNVVTLWVIDTTPFLEWHEKAFKVFLYSLPALSFGAVTFWWFGRK